MLVYSRGWGNDRNPCDNWRFSRDLIPFVHKSEKFLLQTSCHNQAINHFLFSTWLHLQGAYCILFSCIHVNPIVKHIMHFHIRRISLYIPSFLIYLFLKHYLNEGMRNFLKQKLFPNSINSNVPHRLFIKFCGFFVDFIHHGSSHCFKSFSSNP